MLVFDEKLDETIKMNNWTHYKLDTRSKLNFHILFILYQNSLTKTRFGTES